MLLEALPNAPAELVRKDKNFAALGLNESDYTSAASVIEILQEHPQLMQRPIVYHNNRAAIGRPPENVLELFE